MAIIQIFKNKTGPIRKLLNKDKIVAFITFLTSFVVYIITLAPTVLYEDSGEFVTGAHSLGVLHPPGYPIYAILGKLFSYLPIFNVAWRVNLMSAFFAAVSAGILYLIIRKLKISKPVCQVFYKASIRLSRGRVYIFKPLEYRSFWLSH